ncbi:serine hydrolase [Streptomyces sp. NPDC008121]|uniref:serine hydrolase domain-containing protein n=1 Tax=Streptomyces sp. NPDC008121 TaxID=3364809 RepID=UPI0036E8BCAC
MLQQRLRELVNGPQAPPGAIAVLDRNGSVQVYQAGTAQRGTKQPLRTGDYMRIAGISKAFSGAVALGLVSQGRLGLDDTLGKRVPALPKAWHQVTLRQLLSHTSGLPEYSQSPEFQRIFGENPRHTFNSQQLLKFAAKQPLRFPPGTKYAYSNSDNVAAALISEAASGARYDALLKKYVYQPLGLKNTSLPSGYRILHPYMHGYDPADSGSGAPRDVSELFSMSGPWAAAGMVSTPRDLTAFIRAYARGSLLSPAIRSQQLAFVPGRKADTPGPGANAAGLGLYQYTTRCGTVYGHTGSLFGYTQLAAATPDGKRSITFTITARANENTRPSILKKLRQTQEEAVCALLRG